MNGLSIRAWDVPLRIDLVNSQHMDALTDISEFDAPVSVGLNLARAGQAVIYVNPDFAFALPSSGSNDIALEIITDGIE